MKLYQMELYKLLCRKICIIAGLVGIGWLVFYFFAVHMPSETGSFPYGKGWQVFVDIWQFGILICSVWVIFMAAPVFAEESQLRTKALLFTAEKGKHRDTGAKIAAVVSAALLAYLIVFLLAAGLVGIAYGFSGKEEAAGIVLGYSREGSSLRFASIGFVALVYWFLGLAAVLVTAAITLFASGLCKNTFYAVAAALIIYVMPVFLGGMGGVFYDIAMAQPAMAGVWLILFSVSNYENYMAVILAETVLLTAAGYWRYIRI